MNRTLLGLLILLIVAGIAMAVSFLDLSSLTRQIDRRTPVDVAIYYGGEKSALLNNPAVQRIIEDRYKITLDATKAGSIEMATTLDSTGKDCLWPSNMVAVELARQSNRPVRGDETIFNSPIVFYAWSDVADALGAAGVVQERAHDACRPQAHLFGHDAGHGDGVVDVGFAALSTDVLVGFEGHIEGGADRFALRAFFGVFGRAKQAPVAPEDLLLFRFKVKFHGVKVRQSHANLPRRRVP